MVSKAQRQARVEDFATEKRRYQTPKAIARRVLLAKRRVVFGEPGGLAAFERLLTAWTHRTTCELHDRRF